MLTRMSTRKVFKQDGESPFWISFSDLMSALMTLFLVVMSVTLITVTKGLSAEEEAKIQREQDIREIMEMIREQLKDFPEIRIDEATYRVDIGNVVQFESGRSNIDVTKATYLRQSIPRILNAYNTELGKRWIRRVVVEGYTDQDGTYLYNLGLSLNRSKSVVCALFAPPSANEVPLGVEQKRQIQALFLVGGYSFNSIRENKDESRRVELKLEFWAVTEEPAHNQTFDSEFGQC